jgi:hypothetical protein
MSGAGIFIIVIFGFLAIAAVYRVISDKKNKKDKQA